MLAASAIAALAMPANTHMGAPMVTAGNKVCGVYGDPHLELPDGTLANHQGSGEYSLLSLPSLGAEVHYYGCGVTEKEGSGVKPGTFVGALAVKIGDKVIEIVGNELSVVGGDRYSFDYENDKVFGPIEVSASSTTITIEREAMPIEDLYKAKYADQQKIAAGELLYRWTITTPKGFELHSHAVPVKGAEGGWVLDIMLAYPEDKADNVNGLCVDTCEARGGDDCGSASSCFHVNSSATYGIAPIFSEATLAKMATTCPHTQLDVACAPQNLAAGATCIKLGVPIKDANLACVHLSAMSDTSHFDACVLDYCEVQGDASAEKVNEDWYKEHNPPDDVKCKVVADPHFTSFDAYKFSFAGAGAYELLKKEKNGKSDPCEIEIQTLECAVPCPGYGCGQSYVYAVGIKAPGGNTDHELIFSADSCTIDGAACDTQKDKNIGKDGVKLVAYTPIDGVSYPNLGKFGRNGEHGWYVVAGGFGVNVTMTLPTEPSQAGPIMMNVITASPPMCTSTATGLCKTEADTKDKLLQSYAADYLERSTNARHDAKKAAKGQQQLDATGTADDIPALATYPTLDTAVTLHGLKAFSCPA